MRESRRAGEKEVVVVVVMATNTVDEYKKNPKPKNSLQPENGLGLDSII